MAVAFYGTTTTFAIKFAPSLKWAPKKLLQMSNADTGPGIPTACWKFQEKETVKSEAQRVEVSKQEPS
jgi:hypothetical protein